MSQVALLTACHDPEGNNIALYKNVREILKKYYSEIYITISDETNVDLIDELYDGNAKIRIIPKKGAANARREVLGFGLEGNAIYFHYCDFDRLVTWANGYPDELINVINMIPDYQFLILGRTERALYTHPTEWIETEKITNKIFSLEFGREVDITSGSSGFSRGSAILIKEYSQDEMTDAEWPMIIHRFAKSSVGFKQTEGLEFNEKNNGYTRKLSESEKWFYRLKLCYIISESAMKTGKGD